MNEIKLTAQSAQDLPEGARVTITVLKTPINTFIVSATARSARGLITDTQPQEGPKTHRSIKEANDDAEQRARQFTESARNVYAVIEHQAAALNPRNSWF